MFKIQGYCFLPIINLKHVVKTHRKQATMVIIMYTGFLLVTYPCFLFLNNNSDDIVSRQSKTSAKMAEVIGMKIVSGQIPNTLTNQRTSFGP